jgi:hypothetical protein
MTKSIRTSQNNRTTITTIVNLLRRVETLGELLQLLFMGVADSPTPKMGTTIPLVHLGHINRRNGNRKLGPT